jgi:hypothetical protein
MDEGRHPGQQVIVSKEIGSAPICAFQLAKVIPVIPIVTPSNHYSPHRTHEFPVYSQPLQNGQTVFIHHVQPVSDLGKGALESRSRPAILPEEKGRNSKGPMDLSWC